jgi:hypothetical protein
MGRLAMSIGEGREFAFGFTTGGMVVSMGLLAWDALSIWWNERIAKKSRNFS